ncbi:MAG: DUF2130 domain-containing protein [Thermodesulfovibrionales bacterium]
MEDQTIICPNCGKKIPLTEAIYHQIKETLKKEFAEQVEEKEKELEKRKNLLDKEAQKLEDSRKTLEKDLKRKSEQGSIQTQGEVLELDFEELLKTKFTSDEISPDKYLSRPEFKQKVEAIVEAFKSMKEDLEQEKRAMLRIWNKREKEIERVITNTVGMYGDLQGIIGTSMPKIKMLELEEVEKKTNPSVVALGKE